MRQGNVPDAAVDADAAPARRVIHLVVAGLVAFVVWASIAPLTSVVRAPGQLVLQDAVRAVQTPDAGRIAQLLVREGDTVAAGQIVARMDATLHRTALADLAARETLLSLQILRLAAEAAPDRAVLAFPAALIARAPQAAAIETALFDARIAQYRQTQTLLADIRSVRAAALAVLDPLVARGAVGAAEQIAARQALLDMDRQMTDLRTGFETARAQRAADLHAVLVQLRAERALRQAQLDRSVLRAPVAGIVDRIGVAPTGAVVQAGATVVDIVPITAPLIVTARIAPGDIAPLSPGMPATVKLTAYDYRDHASLRGRVTRISATTQRDPGAPGAEAFYLVTLTLDAPHPAGITLRPGMLAEVALEAGAQSVLATLLAPLSLAGTAFSEPR